ncbi:MAG TPA: helix-hairpin-helix domain-containing protein [Gemmataceae bacterium]|jgi:competence ComEA-like helix-hairpin-helix protein|nr:helix-hairpin-helix domain-containing protein [Gemmataceae bacterium]
MSTPPIQPVPPVAPATPPPAVADAPVPRRTQFAAVFLVVFLAVLVGWRWCTDQFGTRPTELQRDPTHRIDLNRATRVELMQVPGVGPSLADRIVAERGARGKFNRVDDLAGVHGIGDATLNKIRPWVVVEASDDGEPAPPEPDRLVRKPTRTTHTVKKPDAPDKLIDINTATAAELDKLPGIGPVLAGRIVAEREKKPFTKVEDLRRVSGIGPKKMEAIRPLVTVRE